MSAYRPSGEIKLTIIIRSGRARVAWVTVVPLVFLAITTLTAGYMSVRDNFWPMAVGPNPALHVQGYIDAVLATVMMICVLIMIVTSVRLWKKALWPGPTRGSRLADGGLEP